jgi:hypothetical protein
MITPVDEHGETLQVRNADYQATFDADGLTYTPVDATGGVGIDLATIDRGGRPIDLVPRRWTPNGDVASRALGDGLREQVTARSGEVEWDVVLAHEPAGAGDLTVRAGLSGTVGRPVRTADGTAWQLTAAGGVPIRLGETVVKDAQGFELHRALPDVATGQVSLTVPHEVLAGARYPLVVDPTVGSPTTVRNAASVRTSVAFDGEDWLVVWDENEVFGAQVQGDGSRVQPIGPISVTGDARTDWFADVAWNGSSFLVVWQDEFSGTDTDVLARRVNRAGFPTGGVIPVSTPTSQQRLPAVTAAGSTFYVAWDDNRAGNFDIFGARVGADLSLPDGIGVAVTTDARSETFPDVAWNGTHLLVVYGLVGTNGEDVYARRVNTSAAPVGDAFPVSTNAGHQTGPAVASNGSDWLVVWSDNRNNIHDTQRGFDIIGSRVNGSGVVLDGGINISVKPGQQSGPAVAFDGSYLVVWREGTPAFPEDDVFAGRLTSAGVPQDGTGFPVAADPDDLEGGLDPAVAPGPGTNRWAVEYELFTDYPDGTASLQQRIISK